MPAHSPPLLLLLSVFEPSRLSKSDKDEANLDEGIQARSPRSHEEDTRVSIAEDTEDERGDDGACSAVVKPPPSLVVEAMLTVSVEDDISAVSRSKTA